MNIFTDSYHLTLDYKGIKRWHENQNLIMMLTSSMMLFDDKIFKYEMDEEEKQYFIEEIQILLERSSIAARSSKADMFLAEVNKYLSDIENLSEKIKKDSWWSKIFDKIKLWKLKQKELEVEKLLVISFNIKPELYEKTQKRIKELLEDQIPVKKEILKD